MGVGGDGLRGGGCRCGGCLRASGGGGEGCGSSRVGLLWVWGGMRLVKMRLVVGCGGWR